MTNAYPALLCLKRRSLSSLILLGVSPALVFILWIESVAAAANNENNNNKKAAEKNQPLPPPTIKEA